MSSASKEASGTIVTAAFLAALVALGLSSLPGGEMVAGLAAIAAVAYSLSIWIAPDDVDAGGTTYDATVAVALVGLYVAGPAAAFAIWMVPELMHRCVFRRSPVLTWGLALNALSFAAAVIAGAVMLALVDEPAGAIAAAGAAMMVFNFTLSPLLYAIAFESRAERKQLLAQARSLLLIDAAVLVAGAAAALATERYGAIGLAVLAVAVALPEVRWARLLPRPLAEVGPDPLVAPRLRARSRDETYEHAAQILDALQVQLAAVVSAAAPPDRTTEHPADFEDDLAAALVALRRAVNGRALAGPYQDGAEAMIRLLERRVGPQLLRAAGEPRRSRR